MKTLDSLQFAQLLASRICHDLISPVCAVNNGIELLLEEKDDADSRQNALELIEDSAKMAAIKLKMMRAAFGAGQVLSENCSVNDLLSLCQPIADKNKVSVQWHNPDNRCFNLNEGRLILNLMLVILEALPRGGDIQIDTHQGISFSIASQKLIFSDDKVAYLTGTQEIPVEPRYIGFYLLKLLANTQHYAIQKQDNQLEIKLVA
jgi:histidine phosphotransferase ChpT